MTNRLVAVLTVMLALPGSAAAQSEGAEASFRIGGGAASLLAREGVAGTLGGSVTWPVGRRLRMGPSLDVIGIVNADECPLDETGCDDPPGVALLLGLRMQQNRTGLYLFGAPTYLVWWEEEERQESRVGLTAGIGHREPGATGFVAELGLTGAFESRLTGVATLTVGFAFGVRPPRFEPPALPRPGVPPEDATGDDANDDAARRR